MKAATMYVRGNTIIEVRSINSIKEMTTSISADSIGRVGRILMQQKVVGRDKHNTSML